MRGEAHWLSTEAGGLVWPSDVRTAMVRVDAEMKAVLADAHNCGAVPDATRADFVSFWTSWRYFYCGSQQKEPGVQLLTCSEPDVPSLLGLGLGMGEKMDAVDDFESKLAGWQKLIGEYCKLSSPAVTPKPAGALPDVANSLVWLAGLGLVAYVLHETGALKLVKARTA
jgi:hypothetical protein